MITPVSGASTPIDIEQPDNPQIGRARALANRIAEAVRWLFRLIFPCCCAIPSTRPDSPALPPPVEEDRNRSPILDQVPPLRSPQTQFSTDQPVPFTAVSHSPNCLAGPRPSSTSAARRATSSPPPRSPAATPEGAMALPLGEDRARSPILLSVSRPPESAAALAVVPNQPHLGGATRPPPPLAAGANTSPDLTARPPAARPWGSGAAADEAERDISPILLRIRNSYCPPVPLVDNTIQFDLPNTEVIINHDSTVFLTEGTPETQALRERHRFSNAYKNSLIQIGRLARHPTELFAALQCVRNNAKTAEASLRSQVPDQGQEMWPQITPPEELTDLENTAWLWYLLSEISRRPPRDPTEQAGLLFHAAKLADRIGAIPDPIRIKIRPTIQLILSSPIKLDGVVGFNEVDASEFNQQLQRNYQTLRAKFM